MKRSFRFALALRTAGGMLALALVIGVISSLALRALLFRQLDGTLVHLAEAEAQAGAAHTGSEFEFHEGILLTASPEPSAELTRYAQLRTSDGAQVIGTVGPVLPPRCRSRYCSIPVIIDCPNVSVTVVAGETATAAGAGLTAIKVPAAGAVESRQPPVATAARATKPRKAGGRTMSYSGVSRKWRLVKRTVDHRGPA